jgi:hydroxyacyl-ACP dehydratase HTD2-like protein with hotdog domain
MFNAHSIHYDRKYTQDIEGYRDLLVPGPLSLTLMLTALRPYLSKLNRVITEIEYRNLAPLYVDEEMKICAKGIKNCELDSSLAVWIQGKDGRLALRGTVKTEKIEQG